MKADLHIHSNLSDGYMSPEEIVDSAIERGISCICITDHNEIKGSIRAMKYAFDKDILVIPGIEIETLSGDILAIGVKKMIPDYLSAQETISRIKKEGGFSVIPHPFHWPTNHFRESKKIIISLKPDAIEVFNASLFYNSANKKALKFAQKNNFAFTAGSDTHGGNFIGRAYVETLKNINSEREFLEEIRKKRIKVNGKKLDYWEIFNNFSKVNVGKVFRSYFVGVKKKYN